MDKRLIAKISKYDENEEFIGEDKIYFYTPDEDKCFLDKSTEEKILIKSGENISKGASIESEENNFNENYKEVDL